MGEQKQSAQESHVSNDASQLGDKPARRKGDIRRFLERVDADGGVAGASSVGRAINDLARVANLGLSSLAASREALRPYARFRNSMLSVSEIAQEEARRKARKEAERISREEATLEELHAIRIELQYERQARERLEAQVQELSRYRTGSPGRPGSKHLVIAEFNRRVAAGVVEAKLVDEARILEAWLKETHPQGHPMKTSSIENLIREWHRDWRLRRQTTGQRK